MPTIPIEKGVITSGYGERILHGIKEFHPGIDIGVPGNPTNVKVVAAYPGRVVVIKYSYSFGNVVYVRRTDKMLCIYPHLAFFNPALKVGDQLNEGDYIGIMGNTGHSFGEHLHFEIRPDFTPGNSIDPVEITALYNSPNQSK